MEIKVEIVAQEIVQAINNLAQAIRESKVNTSEVPQIGDITPDTQPQPNPAQVKEEVTPKYEPSFTVEEVRKAFIDLKKEKGKEAVLEILQKYEAKSITALEQSTYDDVMKDIGKELEVTQNAE